MDSAATLKFFETVAQAQVSLQGLLDHTIERLAKVAKLDSLRDEDLSQVTLHTKWGFSGSSGHSDFAVCITSIVPLKLICNGKTIWQNPHPSSMRYCRPLKLVFAEEIASTGKIEIERVENEIKTLVDSTIKLKERIIKANHILMLVMVDGKVCNAITDTFSAQTCYLCGATSQEFNSIDMMIARNANTESIKFGLSISHSWIRFFECLIHLSYKIPIKKWQAESESEKQIVADTKSRIQKEFGELTGMIIDLPKPGFGNSINANTARRFFRNAEVFASITNVDVELIKRMHAILIAVSCGHEIHIDNFRNFGHITAKHFVKLYPWYYMPPTLHKFFIHGPEIVSHALLPIGQLSEEVQTARNKDFEHRQRYARIYTRKQTCEVIFKRFLLTSDPLISSLGQKYIKKVRYLPQMTHDLLILHNTPDEEDDDDDEDDYDDEDEDEPNYDFQDDYDELDDSI